MLTLELVDHGGKCPNRGIPLIDVYLMGPGGCWLQALDMSVPMANVVAEWFSGHGVKISREEASAQPEHSRDLFTES